MFTRKKRELIKTPSISKKSRAGSPGPQSSASSVSRCITSGFSLAPLLSSARVWIQGLGCPSPVATLKRPTALSRHASAAGLFQAQGALTPSPLSEGPESTAIEVEDIPALLRDVARFAEAVEKLKDVVLAEGKKESQRPVAHECLGEVLRVLRQVINTYPLLNTVEILTAAGKLISKVKGFHYEACNEADKKDFEKAIETIAVAFSSNVSELLMGEVDSSTLLSLLPTEKSRSMENLYAATGHGADGGQFRSDLQDVVEEVDVILQHSEGGVDSALLYAKTISKYMKDLITYPHMPLFSIYSLALEQDQEQSVGLQQASTTLHSQTFIQPLMQRKQEHEKRRKEIKEQWIRAKRKLMECEVNLRKAKQAYVVRCEEHDKAKTATCRAEEEGGGSTAKSVEKKKRLEEEARNKADEAEATYRTCIADATTQQLELEHTKVTVLRQLQDVIKQSDQTLRSATISYYQLMHMQTVALPVHYQTLCESSKLYDPGQQYAAHVRDLQLPEQPNTYSLFAFTGQGHKSWGSTVSDDSVAGDGESPTASSTDVSKIVRTSSTGTMSSNEDADEKDGNVASFETPNINGMDPDVVVSTRPFRNIGLSKAAQTHRLRKLRTPAKCRECDSYVYFQGAECEECFLACHKRCLETLAIQCGHKKLQGRLQLFGREFAQVASCASDGIPFIITKCISEIERRALKMKGIYRVNGVKTRVEKLCQAFENGKELVELSQCSPHDISNVLKLYLRQLPEPIMPFRLYNSLMGLAKESLQSEGDAPEGVEAESSSINPAVGRGPELVDLGPDTDPEVLVLVDKLKELLKELPKANLSTLRYIIRHLRRIAELEEDNKMSPSNLGIVFGPSLMRPRPTGATISLSSLVDYPHQARIVEALIVFYSSIFQSKTSQSNKACRTSFTSTQQVGVLRLDSHLSFSLGSLGSSEQLPDTDSEQDESGQRTARPHSLMKQESEVSLDEDQVSYRDSLDLSSQSAIHTDPELDVDQGQSNSASEDPPALPDSGPPDDDTGVEQNLSATLAELNVNQSNNNNYYCSPSLSLSGLPLARLCGKKLSLSRNRDSEPDFV
uniref:Rho GTPase activating protein 45b n=1 Tax=Mastacembelus armatus TaxID=205130 RepID=A0A7N8WYY9_9TELE